MSELALAEIDKQRAAPAEIVRQAKASAKEDKVELFRFFLPLKPTRGYLPEQQQTVENFLTIVEKMAGGEKVLGYSSKKMDGINTECHAGNTKALVLSEDGADNTDRYPGITRELQALTKKDLVVLCEIEHWREGQHLPRESAVGYAHSKEDADDSEMIANVYDIVYLEKDIHKLPFEERWKILKSLPFKQSTSNIPNIKFRVNLVPHMLARSLAEVAEQTEFLRRLPGSEGQVFKFADFGYLLTGQRSTMVKFHNSSLIYALNVRSVETKVSGVHNHFFSILPEGKPLQEKDKAVIDGKELVIVGKTFSTKRAFKKGDPMVVECETLNLEHDVVRDTWDVTAWAPRVLPLKFKKLDTITSAVARAKKNYCFQEKEIRVKGEVIYKGYDELEEFAKAEKAPATKENPFLTYFDEDETYRFVVQEHWRGKSVSDLTPVIARVNGVIEVIPIKNLFPKDCMLTQVPLSGIEVWGRNGWEKACWIFRHKLENTRMLRVNALSGVAEVTEDHSLFRKGQPIQAQDLSEGAVIDLKSELPSLPENYAVDLDYAWILGFFLAEGHFVMHHCRPKSVVFTQKEKGVLKRIEHFAKSYGYPHHYERVRKDEAWRLVVAGLEKPFSKATVKSIHEEKMRASRLKIVPSFVFSWTKPCKKQFFEGFFAGDGSAVSKTGGRYIASVSQSLMQGLYLLQKNLQPQEEFTFSLQGDLFRGALANSKHNRYDSCRGRIKAIKIARKQSVFAGVAGARKLREANSKPRFPLGPIPWIFNVRRWVYDIETESHSFVAGIGRILAHNSTH